MPDKSNEDQRLSMEELLIKLEEFVRERDWEQFHTPKNLAVSISIEAAELLEHFQWVVEGSPESANGYPLEAIAEEAADVYLYLLLFCKGLGIDLNSAALEKLRKNAGRYPVRESYGKSTKCTDLPTDDAI